MPTAIPGQWTDADKHWYDFGNWANSNPVVAQQDQAKAEQYNLWVEAQWVANPAVILAKVWTDSVRSAASGQKAYGRQPEPARAQDFRHTTSGADHLPPQQPQLPHGGVMDAWQMPMGGNGNYMRPGTDYDGRMPDQVSASLMPHILPRHSLHSTLHDMQTHGPTSDP
jgi:hypothetical protein